jgi:hypothetical protein
MIPNKILLVTEASHACLCSLPSGLSNLVVEFVASRVDDGHLTDVIILDQLINKKRRDIRTGNP